MKQNELIFAFEHELGTAINRIQKARFDVIVLDANIEGMPIERTIQILRGIDPAAKIIVKTSENSMELEAKVRQERIFYYHLDSFGYDDLYLAIKSALRRSSNFYFAENGQVSKISKSILIVDENDEFIDIHRANLENHNYVVDVCYDADEAYDKTQARQPHLIMVDFDIHVGSDGQHFMEKVMTDGKLNRIPVLLFVSKIRMHEFEQLMKNSQSSLPTWTYLKKPVKIEDVIPQVEKLLNPIQ